MAGTSASNLEIYFHNIAKMSACDHDDLPQTIVLGETAINRQIVQTYSIWTK